VRITPVATFSLCLLHKRWIVSAMTALGKCRGYFLFFLFGLYLPTVHALPVLDLSAQDARYFSVDIRQHWHAQWLPGQTLPAQQAQDPSVVWALPDSAFSPTDTRSTLRFLENDRWVGRLALLVHEQPTNMVLELPMPRLDAAHLSYRYNEGPWIRASAGDQIEMVQWPFANRNPAFFIPTKPGKLHLVLEVAHQGLLSMPVQLQSDPQFRSGRFEDALRIGALLGLAAVLSVLGFGAAAIFQRFSFVAVALLTISVGIAVFTQGGTAGMYIAQDSVRFNDVSKFSSGMLCGAFLPWAFGSVLLQKSYTLWVWRLTQLWLVLGVISAVLMAGAGMRSLQAAVLPAYLLSSLVLTAGMVCASVLRQQAQAWWLVGALVFVSIGILTPLAAYFGLTDGPQSFVISSVGFLVSTTVLFYTQLLQYKQGRMVMARAKTTFSRDVLTGLLNRRGFEKSLANTIKRVTHEKTYAAFYYIEVKGNKDSLQNDPSEGYEAGMVQLAAAVSMSVSVVDTVARVAPNAFAVTVVMPRNALQATALAQKIITRTLAIASHGTPMAHTARIAIAWLPVFGTDLYSLERRAHNVLGKIESGKRIIWVGGTYAQVDESQMPGGVLPEASAPATDHTTDNALPSLPGIINSIEREMFGSDSEKTSQKARRMVPVQRK
jgi:GGDEF domain-containing protein/riboflavin transporter FmnP